jgi:hypothetical protein
MIRVGVIAAACIVGIGLILAMVAGASGGRDHTGDVVRPDSWANDVCGTVGAWEGELHDIRTELSRNNPGARPNDGASGDHVEWNLTVREAVNRAIAATQDTLQEGLKRAGIPDTPGGPPASLALRTWAQLTEDELNKVQNGFDSDPDGNAGAFGLLGAAAAALARSAAAGRVTFAAVAALDPALASALDGSRNCRRLGEDQP